jgi:pyruvate formate lyase activating enzyme
MTSGVVFDVKRFSLHDGPGIRTTIFLKGCGLRCWWCHNPESQHRKPELLLRPDYCIGCGACVPGCPQQAIVWEQGQFITDRDRCIRCGECITVCYADAREIVGQEMTVDEVMAEIMRDAAFYDESGGGVTFSGGEPLVQADFLLELLQACKTQELHTTVDTCGYIPTKALNRVRDVVDLFLYDIKLLDDTRHQEVTGASNQLILENLEHLTEQGKPVIVRVPIIPTINDDAESLEAIASYLSTLTNIERVDILAYHRIGSDKYERLARINPMPVIDPPSANQMIEIQERFKEFGLLVKIGG